MAKTILSSPQGYNATLSYVNQRGAQVFNFWLTELSQEHTLAGQTQQSKMFQHFYGKSYAPGDLVVTGRVPNQFTYDTLAQYVREHHLLMMTQPGTSNSRNGGLNLMNLHVQSEALYYAGWIKSFAGGVQRFNVAPPITFNFEVINDLHSTNNEIIPSAAKQAAFSGSFLSGSVSQIRQAQQAQSNPVSGLWSKKPLP